MSDVTVSERTSQSLGVPSQNMAFNNAIDAIGVTNLDYRDDDDMTTLLAAEMSEMNMINLKRPSELKVRAVVCSTRERADSDTGEIKLVTRTIFICEDDSVWLTFGVDVERKARMLALATSGKGSFKPPVTVKFDYKQVGKESLVIVMSIDKKEIVKLRKK